MSVVEVKAFNSPQVPSYVALQHVVTAQVCDQLRQLQYKVDDVEITAEQAHRLAAGRG
jgi:hypothetical protein